MTSVHSTAEVFPSKKIRSKSKSKSKAKRKREQDEHSAAVEEVASIASIASEDEGGQTTKQKAKKSKLQQNSSSQPDEHSDESASEYASEYASTSSSSNSLISDQLASESSPTSEASEAVDERGIIAAPPPLSNDTITYYRNIAEALETAIATKNEQEVSIIIQNSMHEILGNSGIACRLCQHTKLSRCMELIVNNLSIQQLKQYLRHVQKYSFHLWTDRNGSHVIESILLRIPSILMEEYTIGREKARNKKQQQSAVTGGQTSKKKNSGHDSSTEQIDGDGHGHGHGNGDVSFSSPAEEEDNEEPMSDLLIAMCTELSKVWLDLLANQYASFLLRDLLLILAGKTEISKKEQQNQVRGWNSTSQTSIKHVDCCSSILLEIVDSIVHTSDEEIKSMPFHTTASPALATLLYALALRRNQRPLLDKLIRTLLGWNEAQPEEWGTTKQAQEHVFNLVRDRNGSHVMEAILSSAANLRMQIYKVHFKHHILEWSVHPQANYTVQALLNSATEPKLVKYLFVDLYSVLPQLMQSRGGVIWRLVQACLRTSVKKSKLIKALAYALNIEYIPAPTSNLNTSNKNLLQILCTYKNEQSEQKDTSEFSHMGCLITQALFTVPNTKVQSDEDDMSDNEIEVEIEAATTVNTGDHTGKQSNNGKKADVKLLPATQYAIDCLLYSSIEFLLSLARHPAGSRVLEAFLQSNASLVQKRKLIDKFKLNYIHLGVDQFGSFALERFYEWSDIQRKKQIANELCQHSRKLESSRSGTVLIRKLHLEHFKHDPKTWITIQTNQQKKLNLFKEIFHSNSNSSNAASMSTSSAAAGAGNYQPRRQARQYPVRPKHRKKKHDKRDKSDK